MTQLHRYEADTFQPTMDVLRMLAVALQVSADLLPFENRDGGQREDLRLQLEAVTRLDPDEKAVVKSVLEGLVLEYAAKRLVSTP